MAKLGDFDEQRKQKTKNRLSISHKRKADDDNDIDEERSSRIENDIQTVILYMCILRY